MRGSKYIQSEMKDIFRSVKADLGADKEVLLSGTSCQISGLTNFLNREYPKLLCEDIVCHGVSSPMIWRDDLKWQEEKNSCKVVAADFRNKKDFGWKAHVESLLFANGKCVDSTIFTILFYGHSILRPCCYQCLYKDIVHPSNITIGDYWGIDIAVSGFNDEKGMSALMR